MIIIALTITAWLIFRPLARKPRKRTAPAALTAPPVMTAAELARIEKERAKAERDAEKARVKAETERAAREQAKKDYSFYSGRLETLYQMETDTARAYFKAAETVETDAETNRYSYVIPEKIVRKHIAERDKLQATMLKVQNQIHSAENKLTKAKNVLNY